MLFRSSMGEFGQGDCQLLYVWGKESAKVAYRTQGTIVVEFLSPFSLVVYTAAFPLRPAGYSAEYAGHGYSLLETVFQT